MADGTGTGPPQGGGEDEETQANPAFEEEGMPEGLNVALQSPEILLN